MSKQKWFSTLTRDLYEAVMDGQEPTLPGRRADTEQCLEFILTDQRAFQSHIRLLGKLSKDAPLNYRMDDELIDEIMSYRKLSCLSDVDLGRLILSIAQLAHLFDSIQFNRPPAWNVIGMMSLTSESSIKKELV